MKSKIAFAMILTLASFTAARAQTLDTAKLDQFFARLAAKNKALGSLPLAQDGKIVYTRAIGYSQINGTEKKPLTMANRLMKAIRNGELSGMEPFTFAGKTFYGHTGGADNYGAWLMYLPEEKLAVAYTTNAKVYPVGEIVKGVMDIYYNKPFQIPAFESVAVSTEVLDKYVGVYSPLEAPVKFTITRQGATLYAQPPGAGAAAPLEATAQDQFKLDNGTAAGIVFEFDAAKNQMTIKRGGGQRVFTKDK